MLTTRNALPIVSIDSLTLSGRFGPKFAMGP
jgi:hypothetical protein